MKRKYLILYELYTHLYDSVYGHGISSALSIWQWAVDFKCTRRETIDIRLNTLRPRQNGRRFADDTFRCIFWNENVRISIKISLKFVPKGLINNNPALVQIMAWRLPGDKPLSEPMMVSLLTHLCVTRPQWVNRNKNTQYDNMEQMIWKNINPSFDTLTIWTKTYYGILHVNLQLPIFCSWYWPC